MLWLIPSLVFLGAYLGILAVYRYGWHVAGKNDGPSANNRNIFLSVIVPLRNEENNLPQLMNSLFSQQYPAELLEIILVDDDSSDKTLLIAKQYQSSHPNVKVLETVKVFPEGHGKKKAIETGVAAARGEVIVCTDADCLHQPGWLRQMADAFSEGVHFVAAPVVFETESNLLSVFQTLDFMTLQGITAASVALKLHTMCNGANLAYSRNAFHKVGGFKGIDALPTGDDMLLMYKIFKQYPYGIRYVRSFESLVFTKAPSTWKDFFQQRIRWASKAAYFHDKRIFWVLLLVYLFNVWLLVLAIAAIFSKQALLWLVMCISVKIVSELIFLWPVALFFRKTKWMVYFPFLQPVHIVYTILAGWLGRFGSYKWKGRTVQKPSILSKG
ncbi:MAG: glycosyltransferase [Chitinophagaceae bacterium]|nr:glycosyltransferase [Chitinophagaceae bacterium]